jgi:hypothetical protein
MTKESIASSSTGVWRIFLWEETPESGGEPARKDVDGSIVYTPGGFMAVQLVAEGLRIAYYGPRRVDEEGGFVFHEIEVDVGNTMSGIKTQKRRISVREQGADMLLEIESPEAVALGNPPQRRFVKLVARLEERF